MGAHSYEQHLDFPRSDVFHWFSRPGAVTRLTPGLMPMTVVSEAENLRDGETTFAVPPKLTWVARHDPEQYREGFQFHDAAVSQPFQGMTGWEHTHKFADAADGSVVIDEVSTRAVPGAVLDRIFAYRHTKLAGDLEARQRLVSYLDRDELPELTIAVTGATGTVGTALRALLTTSGHRVITLQRSESAVSGADERYWDTSNPASDLLEGVDVLINLAGAPIAGRFTDEHIAKVRNSRVEPSKKLAEVAVQCGVKTIVSASAVGYYGADRGQEILGETADSGSGPLAEICRDWEAAWQPARDAGIRVVTIRTGLVQSGSGGLLPLLAGITFTGLGGKLGDGNQWFPWIALDDLLDVYHRAAVDEAFEGPINAVAPGGMTNAEYTKVLATVLRRPAVIPVPKLGPKLLLGSTGAEELALANQRAMPTALTELGHTFRFPDLAEALAHELLRDSE